MQRVVIPELLDSDDCPLAEVQASLLDISLINRWFGGVATTRMLIERVAAASGRKQFSVLEAGAGLGEITKLVAKQLARKNISLDFTLLDLKQSHLPADLKSGDHAVVANAISLPFSDGAFDLVNSSLFAHHLEPAEFSLFVKEALRVSRIGVLINDLVRHPLHVAIVYAGFPLMRSYVSHHDGVASVRRAYVPQEMREMIATSANGSRPRVEIFRHYLYRMGVIAWKAGANAETLLRP